MFEERKGILENRITKLSTVQYDTLEENCEFFKTMKNDFETCTLVNFHINNMIFTIEDTWADYFQEYLTDKH